jgi:hypothetical protein
MCDKLRIIWRAESKLHDKLGRQPTEEELAAELEISPKQLALRRSASISMQSLDTPLNDEGSDVIGDLVGDNAASPDQIASGQDMIERMMELVGDGILSDRERFIIEKRFGLNDEPRHTLGEIGNMCQVTRERIRQLEAIAIRKLSHALARKDNATVNMCKVQSCGPSGKVNGNHVRRNLRTSKANGGVHHGTARFNPYEFRSAMEKAKMKGLIRGGSMPLKLRIE